MNLVIGPGPARSHTMLIAPNANHIERPQGEL